MKERHQIECGDGTKVMVTTKNGRLMMKCKCVECGIVKTKFVSRKGFFGNLANVMIPVGVIAATPLAFGAAALGSSQAGRDIAWRPWKAWDQSSG